MPSLRMMRNDFTVVATCFDQSVSSELLSTCFLRTATFLTSVYFSIPASPCRDPTPELLNPPEVLFLLAYEHARPSLMLMLPASMRRPMASAALRSLPQTLAFRP